MLKARDNVPVTLLRQGTRLLRSVQASCPCAMMTHVACGPAASPKMMRSLGASCARQISVNLATHPERRARTKHIVSEGRAREGSPALSSRDPASHAPVILHYPRSPALRRPVHHVHTGRRGGQSTARERHAAAHDASMRTGTHGENSASVWPRGSGGSPRCRFMPGDCRAKNHTAACLNSSGDENCWVVIRL